jgi:Glycosyltransferase 61
MKTKIINYTLNEPDNSIMIIENGIIDNNNIYVDNTDKIFLPTMYKGWGSLQKSHINFITSNNEKIINNNNVLYIFDTWGMSSYYHLLIDHIIPLWVTKKLMEEYFFKNKIKIDNSDFLRISNNDYNKELSISKDIFKYFIGKDFTENIKGEYKYIIYGYCYNYKPLNIIDYDYINQRIYYDIEYYPKYKYMLDLFISQYTPLSYISEKYIIIAERLNRTYEHMDKIYNDLNKLYNVKMIDFSKYTVEEQIKLCMPAWAMIGCEGAAFANMIFMKENSLIISLDNSDKIFFKQLSNYMDHRYYVIKYENTEYNIIVDNIKKLLLK